MIVLALDTSSKMFCCGLYADGRVYEYSLEAGTRMSGIVLETVRRIFAAARVKPSDVDYFACGIGPGSFTGTRIGVAAVKGMAWALKKPVVGISSLDTLAEGVSDEGLPIVPLVDAKRGLVYTATYGRARGKLRRRGAYVLVKREELASKIPRNGILLGDAVGCCRELLLRGVRGARFLDTGYWYPRPHVLLRLALERIERGEHSSAAGVEPLYLYPKECQIKSL